MSESAAFFVDHILPLAPIRQWVLSVPIPLRYWMARNPILVSEVLTVTIRILSKLYRTKSKKQFVASGQTGSVTLVQRFGGAINSNIHFHTLFIEGSYEKTGESVLFHPSHSLTDQDVAGALVQIQKKVIELLRKRKLIPEEEGDVGSSDSSIIDACLGASVQSRTALGERAGKRVRRLGSFGEPGEFPTQDGALCATLGGFSLHAGVSIQAHERERLEKLCRYIARPPVAESRLSRTNDGNIIYRFKKEWSDGTRAVLFSPTEFIEKLVALIPQPRIHLTRFHGVLAPNSRLRPLVVPSPNPVMSARDKEKPSRDMRRLRWAELLKRVFQIDITVCPDCGGGLKFIALIMERKVIVSILTHLDLPCEAPKRFLARAPPQREFDYHSSCLNIRTET